MRLEVGWGQDGKGDGESKMGIGSGMGSRTGNRVQHGTRTHAGHGQDSCPLGRTRPVLTVSLCVPPCPRRLERLQRVVTKLQMESGLCEEQLNQADALLQAVSVGGTGVGGPGGTSPGRWPWPYCPCPAGRAAAGGWEGATEGGRGGAGPGQGGCHDPAALQRRPESQGRAAPPGRADVPPVRALWGSPRLVPVALCPQSPPCPPCPSCPSCPPKPFMSPVSSVLPMPPMSPMLPAPPTTPVSPVPPKALQNLL